MKRLWSALVVLLMSAAAAEPSLTVIGPTKAPVQLTLSDLKALKPTTLTWAYTTRTHGDQKGTFTGPPLWDVLGKAIPDAQSRDYLRHVIVITGRDGYAVSLAIAEIDPIYEGKPVLVAYEKDSKPLANGFGLVVPGDREGGRAVHDVVKIEVE